MPQEHFNTRVHEIQSPWSRHAALWHLVTCPLRPHADDVAVAQSVLDELGTQARTVRALILGVTPELTQLRWPANSELVAVDASVEMIQRHWRAPGIRATVVQGEWQSLPNHLASMNAVLADGSLNVLPDLQAVRQVIKQTHATLASDGRFVLRAFTRPDIAESPTAVFDAILHGRIGNIHAAKWRVAMALHGRLANGVQLHTVWQAFHDACDFTRLSQLTGWSQASIHTIDNYRNIRTRYFFPTLTELRGLLADAFTELSCHHFDYELGERCPTLVLKPRRSPQ